MPVLKLPTSRPRATGLWGCARPFLLSDGLYSTLDAEKEGLP
jgi:hypothetical protein